MSQILWVRGPICGVDNCRSRLYRSSDGMKICQYGHVMDGNIEINDEMDEGGAVATRRLNIPLLGSGGASQLSHASQGKIAQRLYGSEGKKLYLKCLQILVKKQTELFINSTIGGNFKDQILLAVRLNWSRCLTYCLSSKESDLNEGMHDSNPDYVYTVTLKAIDSVAVIYLSIWRLNCYPIFVCDMINAIKTNKLPYVKSTHLIPREYLNKLSAFYLQMLQPTSLPLHNELYERIQLNAFRIGSKVDDPFPPKSINYYYPLIFRTLFETLALPSSPDLFLLVDYCFRWLNCDLELQLGEDLKSVETQIYNFPELKILAMICFVVKCYFVFGSNSFNSSEWLEKLQAFETSNEDNFATTGSINVLNWSESKQERYMSWIYDNIIPKDRRDGDLQEVNSSNEVLPIMDKRLLQIFAVNDEHLLSPDFEKRDSDPNALTLFQVYNSMVLDPVKPKVKFLSKIEEKVFNKLGSEFGITVRLVKKCYEIVEIQVKNTL